MTQDMPPLDPPLPQQPVDPDLVKALGDLPEEFQGFPRLFQEEIRPALLSRENERQVAVAKARQARYAGIAVAVLGGLAGVFLIRHPLAAVIPVIIGLGYMFWGGRDVRLRIASVGEVAAGGRRGGVASTSTPSSGDGVFSGSRSGVRPRQTVSVHD